MRKECRSSTYLPAYSHRNGKRKVKLTYYFWDKMCAQKKAKK